MMTLDALIARVAPVDARAINAARERHDALAKPPGSLGRLEALAAQLAGIAGVCPPPIPDPAWLVICAADHGVIAQGVSRWPQEVTAAMVGVFLAGQAASSALAASVGAEIIVVDLGVGTPTPSAPGLVDARIRSGTADLSVEMAMSRDEAERAMLAGADVARGLIDRGAGLIVLGDMGIANTTASACLIAALTGRTPQEVTGRGAGASNEDVAHKTGVVARAIALHQPDSADPLGALAAVGGLEHAGLVGVILAARCSWMA
jgi:nicotinate-nucleotide--dimethylbenzimidazole phosphoribosyltransferase